MKQKCEVKQKNVFKMSPGMSVGPGMGNLMTIFPHDVSVTFNPSVEY